MKMLAEKLILDYLSKVLPDILVTLETSTDSNYVLIERVGGLESDGVARVSFAIQSYGKTLLEACALNDRVKSAMRNIINLNPVSKVDLDSDYNWTDETTKKYRYQAVYDLVLFL
ncbi:hypothetical protein [uncultured Dubosiella sp.]|uniref:hypothetical protein n=1 Tax=uncultured Dubosiella sp. TaxID=1937011 RepID=UPI0025B2856D|nr:hypothetical protein [uncultured Dubosiella sp.]